MKNNGFEEWKREYLKDRDAKNPVRRRENKYKHTDTVRYLIRNTYSVQQTYGATYKEKIFQKCSFLSIEAY